MKFWWTRSRLKQVYCCCCMKVRNRPVSSTVQENIKKNDKENMHGTTAFKATLCGVFILAAFILALRLRLPSLSVDIIRNKTVSVAKHLKYLSFDLFPNKTIPIAKQLKYGFEWVNTDAKIAVDLDLEDPNTVLFLELLYYTWVSSEVYFIFSIVYLQLIFLFCVFLVVFIVNLGSCKCILNALLSRLTDLFSLCLVCYLFWTKNERRNESL